MSNVIPFKGKQKKKFAIPKNKKLYFVVTNSQKTLFTMQSYLFYGLVFGSGLFVILSLLYMTYIK